MNKKVYLTEKGYEELKVKLTYLINVKRQENIKAIQEARALGDLSENAEYKAAKEEQSILETEIKVLEKELENAEIIIKTNSGKVELGSEVKIQYLDDEDEEDEYMIVGFKEADPMNYKISNESPIGQALMNKTVGDICDVKAPNGTYQVKILTIK